MNKKLRSESQELHCCLSAFTTLSPSRLDQQCPVSMKVVLLLLQWVTKHKLLFAKDDQPSNKGQVKFQDIPGLGKRAFRIQGLSRTHMNPGLKKKK